MLVEYTVGQALAGHNMAGATEEIRPFGTAAILGIPSRGIMLANMERRSRFATFCEESSISVEWVLATLRERGAGAQARDAAGVGQALERYLAEPGVRFEAGEASWALIAEKQGAATRTLALLEELLRRG